MFRLISVVTICIPLLAILFGIIEDRQYKSSSKPKYLGSIQDSFPLKTNEFGRFTKPVAIVDHSWTSSSKIFDFFTLKHWDFKSISTENYFIGVAIANFNYVASAFVYIIDRKNVEKKFYQYASKSILAQAVQEQAKSSLDGCTNFNRSSVEYMRFCYNAIEKAYEVNANLPINDDSQVSFDFKIDFSSEKDQSMVLVYPVEETRPVYTHKMAGLPAKGNIKINNHEDSLTDGLSSIDWTLGYSERVSRWKWVSLSAVATDSSKNENISIGINLSDLVYNDDNGISMENAIWINKQVYTVNQIVYEIPKKQYQTSQTWRIYSTGDITTEAPKIQLTFQPWGSHGENINIFVVAVDFIQVFGTYNGSIEIFNRTYVIENAFGVAENHYSKW